MILCGILRHTYTRSPGLLMAIVVDIAMENFIFVYVSDRIENAVGVESCMSPPHREVPPISHFVRVRAHHIHVRLVSREMERRKGRRKEPLNEIATKIRP